MITGILRFVTDELMRTRTILVFGKHKLGSPWFNSGDMTDEMKESLIKSATRIFIERGGSGELDIEYLKIK